MARLFNGTSDSAVPQFSFVPQGAFGNPTSAVSFWLWWDTYANDGKAAISYGPFSGRYFAFVPNHSSGNIMVSHPTAGGSNQHTFPRTALIAGAWHHVFWEFDFLSAPTNRVWIDGVSQTMTLLSNTGSSTSGQGIQPTFMYDSTAGYAAGKLADIAFWVYWFSTPGTVSSGDRSALAAATKRPNEINGHNGSMIFFWPLDIDQGPHEHNLQGSFGGGHRLTTYETTYTLNLTGTTLVDGPAFVMSDAGSAYIPSNISLHEGDDWATMSSISSMSGLDHYCNIIPKFGYSAQAHYDIGSEAAHSWELDDAPHFAFTAELNPEGNPC